MNPPKISPYEPTLPADPLFQLELKIARRADEIARQSDRRSVSDPEYWREAENDVLGSGSTRGFCPAGHD